MANNWDAREAFIDACWNKANNYRNDISNLLDAIKKNDKIAIQEFHTYTVRYFHKSPQESNKILNDLYHLSDSLQSRNVDEVWKAVSRIKKGVRKH